MPTFILNDETKVNSYGFRTLNAGIDLLRFRSNPVMLEDHENECDAVLGKWVNIRIEGSQLKADTEFDSEDPAVASVEGKVTRGYINGCSMGLNWNFDNMQKATDGVYELVKSELVEATICPVPSNANALKLYNPATGERLSTEQIKLSIGEIAEFTSKQNKRMNKLNLSASTLVVLGLENTEDSGAVALAIDKMASQLAGAKTENTQLKAKLDDVVKAQATILIDNAIVEGKLTADVKDSWLKMAMTDIEATSKTIASIPAKSNLSGRVDNPSNAGEVKTVDDFQKLSHEAQLSFKADRPDEYKKLFA